jgi:hypothetical protein
VWFAARVCRARPPPRCRTSLPAAAPKPCARALLRGSPHQPTHDPRPLLEAPAFTPAKMDEMWGPFTVGGLRHKKLPVSSLQSGKEERADSLAIATACGAAGPLEPGRGPQ